ncbi:MAG TPA: hypothetical protein VMU26_27845 [Candidatus Polarisedimenticolia bacterium]|nr:hypothetical protein [Candidatus Polarisedimenticolia bacterium]
MAWVLPVSQGLQAWQVRRALWSRVSQELAMAAEKLAFPQGIWDQTERSQKQLLSRRPGRLFDPPSVSDRLAAAEKGAI